jgi:predicted dithiol-disulfide oxidoreductase (DUF899 family)
VRKAGERRRVQLPLGGRSGGGGPRSSFALEDGVVYHVYSSYARGTDVFNTFYQLLDRAPKGRDEDDIPAGEWWWRRHDEYEDG